MGLCVGGVVYLLVIIDFIFMVENMSYMFVIGFDVIKMVMYEEVMMEDFGGVVMYVFKSGVSYFIMVSDVVCFVEICKLFFYLLLNNFDDLLFVLMDDFEDCEDEFFDILVLVDVNKFYDIKEFICGVVDDGEFFEV